MMDADIDSFVQLTLNRFLAYVKFWTTSCKKNEAVPSTEMQWVFAKALKKELEELGIKNIILTDHCYLIAKLPAVSKKENLPWIGFLAHLDTAEDVNGMDVVPVLAENYNGEKIEIGEGLVLDPEKEKGLSQQKGKSVVHTNGKSLLGADDKAGIAAIMGAVEYLLKHTEIEHGGIEIIFTPDEETGKGLPEFPFELVKSKVCYTLDGGPKGEIEYECFNAYNAEVEFKGKAIHPGTARGVMQNASLMAALFAGMLPRSESPEATDGYYGYYCLHEIGGNLENAKLEILIRDFDKTGIERRINALEIFAKATEAQFPGSRVNVKIKKQYLNMKEKLVENPKALEKLRAACRNLGIEIKEKPIRGGTDGSCLTEMGIPTPNIFTGGRNFHSRLEWLAAEEMAFASALVIEIIKLWSEDRETC